MPSCLFLFLSAFLALVAEAATDPGTLIERYQRDHPGKGKFAEHWQPIPIQRYWNPRDFYHPPQIIRGEVGRDQCVTCHEGVTPGFVEAWRNSTHAHLDRIRTLPDRDVRAYKKTLLAEVEADLVRQGLLEAGKHLKEVGCIDCHGGIGKDKIRHDRDLRMPDRSVCGTCHVRQFAEAESEKEQTWPQNQWPQGHPSHAVDWKANVETAIWAAMAEREIAQGCDMCHYQQNKCDGCHTRHSFSAAEARRPEACATCHNGVDHNEFENYLLSKHGTIYQTHQARWNFEAPLEKALTRGGYTAPTCQLCHFEYRGRFSHNLVRKARWGFNPTPAIADNLDHPWFRERLDAWVGTCSQCHSPRFARTWLETADRGILAGLKVEQEAKRVVQALYDDGLLVGQKGDRPRPPPPVTDAPGDFFQLFWARGNNPSRVERIYAEMWEHDLIKLYKGLVHANPGGFTYSEGWSPLLRDYAEIMDENTRLREKGGTRRTALAEIAKLAGADPRLPLGLALMAGGLVVLRRRR